MFNSLGWPEIALLVVVALFIFGPERLPKVIGDLLAGLRRLRTMAQNATSDLSRELGTTIELEDLHPKTFLRKHLLSEAEEAALRKPFQDVYRDVRGVTDAVNLEKPARSNGGAPRQTPTPTPKPEYRYDDAT